ncbi:hypothetical protein EVAR_6356_1 [Eumeta japonica]|uniref:Uncharacterized protein n=1 Tax=Eumeta variegata TaxID=151549 RepID=A0A4C1TCH3_EUMVA|nr:hypothetical protein EVAR_6356_1 [Eumeta japonica]
MTDRGHFRCARRAGSADARFVLTTLCSYRPNVRLNFIIAVERGKIMLQINKKNRLKYASNSYTVDVTSVPSELYDVWSRNTACRRWRRPTALTTSPGGGRPTRQRLWRPQE